MQNRFISYLSLALASSLLLMSSCGKKGPLYLDNEHKAQLQQKSVADTTKKSPEQNQQ